MLFQFSRNTYHRTLPFHLDSFLFPRLKQLSGDQRTSRGGRGGTSGKERRAPGSAAASKRFCRQFERDRSRFSLDRGTNKYIKRARTRLDLLPGASELVRSMASFMPESRPTMLEVMRSEVFEPLRRSSSPSRGRDREGGGGGAGCLEFMTFARRAGDKPLANL